MNLLETLPTAVVSLANSPAARNAQLRRMSDYLARNKPIFKQVRNPKFTQHALQMAAHSCRLWFIRWENPQNRRVVFVVGCKSDFKTYAEMNRILNQPHVLKGLVSWT